MTTKSNELYSPIVGHLRIPTNIILAPVELASIRRPNSFWWLKSSSEVTIGVITGAAMKDSKIPLYEYRITMAARLQAATTMRNENRLTAK